MSDANIEINKQEQEQDLVIKENIEERQNSIIDVNDYNNDHINSFSKKSAGPELEIKLEKSFNAEKKVSKKGEEPPEYVPKHIGFDWRYTSEIEEDKKKNIKGDDIGMRDVRRKLYNYLKSAERGTISDQHRNLQRLIRECDNYCRGKFYIFKWGRRAGERLKEVKALKREAKKRLEALPKKDVRKEGTPLIYTSPQHYIGPLEVPVVLGRFLIENPIRLGLSVLTMPVWLVNEAIRSIQRKTGRQQNRRIKIPWMHRWMYYSNLQEYKIGRNPFGLSRHRSFWERFFVHGTDYSAMDRADADYEMANEEEIDYEDDDFDLAEEEAWVAKREEQVKKEEEEKKKKKKK